MIEKKEAQDFIDLNKKALTLLAIKMKEIDTVRGVVRLQDCVGRQQAIRIVDEWIKELWGMTLQEIETPEEEDDIIRIINK
jgi:hypothetical protein